MKENYQTCEDRVLASEGGYTNDPRDPGGPTNWGITIFDARMYWKHNATSADVKRMPKEVAQDIFRKKYWAALDCDDLPYGLDYTVFDYGVNSGIGRSGRILRKCLGLGQADWHVTPEIISAANRADIAILIADINEERINFLHTLKTWPHFGRGWASRVTTVKADSLKMEATHAPAPIVAAVPQPQAKAVDHPQHLFSHLSEDAWRAVKGAFV